MPQSNRSMLAWIVLAALLLAGCQNSASTPRAVTQPTPQPVPTEFAGKTNPLAGTEADLAAGQENFKNTCATCHGEKALGDGPAASSLVPAPANLVEVARLNADDYLFWRISEGKEGTAMVAWKSILNETQIWQIISYLHSLK